LVSGNIGHRHFLPHTLRLCVSQGIQLNYTVPATSRELPENVTTTEAPYVLTQQELLRLLRRNFRGVVRLFNTESRKAIEVRLILGFECFNYTSCNIEIKSMKTVILG
jgi:hypothetical protein